MTAAGTWSAAGGLEWAYEVDELLIFMMKYLGDRIFSGKKMSVYV